MKNRGKDNPRTDKRKWQNPILFLYQHRMHIYYNKPGGMFYMHTIAHIGPAKGIHKAFMLRPYPACRFRTAHIFIFTFPYFHFPENFLPPQLPSGRPLRRC
jgi:hypothetical protein